jgi:lipid II isoglutaminyl synthase (glutamine-hydrolysing)
VSAPGRGEPLTIAVVYPDLLGTYGDGGNGMVLARRAAWRGLEVELVSALSGARLPAADVYCLGGGEDAPEVRAADLLREDGTLVDAAAGGAVVLGVCAGYQLLGRSFPDAAGNERAGLGLLDVVSRKGTGRRAVGELLAEVVRPGPRADGGPTLPALNGFENHGAVTTVGPGSTPLARVVRGVGNGDGSGTEGAWSKRILGTYLHGPLLARNVALADVLLGWALHARGRRLPLDPLDDTEESALRAERVAASAGSGGSRVLDRILRR